MAGEIYIADKPTLDSVKQDTQYIKNQFPISGGIKNVQRGTFSCPGHSDSYDVRISSVNVSKSFVNVQPFLHEVGNTLSNNFVAAGSLTSSTTLRIILKAVPNFVVYWEVIEFN